MLLASGPLKMILCSLALIFVLEGSLHSRQENSIYKEVKNEHLKALAFEKMDDSSYDVPDEQEDAKKEDNKLVIEELNNYVQHDLVTSMFVDHGRLQDNKGVIDSTFIRKMEMLCGGENAQQHFLGRLIQADSMSIFGEVGCASILINPTTDIPELRHRQQIIKMFKDILHDESAYQEVSEIFEAIKNVESEIARYWHAEPEMNKKLFERVYFGSSFIGKYTKGLNNSTIALEVSTRLRNLLTGFGITSPLFAIIGVNAVTAYFDKNGEISKSEATWEGIAKTKDQLMFLNPFLKAFKDRTFHEIEYNFNMQNIDVFTYQQQIEPQSMGDVFHVVDYLAEREGVSSAPIKGGVIAYGCLLVGAHAYSVNKIVNEGRTNMLVTNYIHERLIALATCIQEAKKLYTFLQSYKATADMPAVKQLGTFFENGASNHSSNFLRLLNMLQTNTFKGEPSFFSLTGRVLAAHTLMMETKDELIPLLEALGHVEAYFNVAKLYNQHEAASAKFCFPEFIEAENPTIVMNDFWNMFIDPEVVVTNDIQFNNFDVERNVILTGPNTAGKSTVIKGVGLNILLGQTFGICAAEKALFTPFSIINCHLNITDDIANGSSLFQAEVVRARALLDDIQSLSKDKFCFTVMDEVFNGTNAEGGSDAAYKFSDQLGQYHNLILVIATHFGALTDLDETGNFKNLHVGAHLDEAGSLIRPCKLEDGIFKDPENKILQAILEKEGVFAY